MPIWSTAGLLFAAASTALTIVGLRLPRASGGQPLHPIYLPNATFANAPAEHAVLVAWVMSHGPARRVGIEGAGKYAWQLTLALQRAGEDVREVPGCLTRRERRHQRHPGKSDPTDAVAIARVVAREEALPAAPLAGPARDLKVLVNYRGGLATERTRVANQLHADLRALRPGYGRTLGHLTGRTALETASLGVQGGARFPRSGDVRGERWSRRMGCG